LIRIGGGIGESIPLACQRRSKFMMTPSADQAAC
jgi:hypothetical protein